MERILRRLISAAVRAGDASGNPGRMFVIRARRSQSSIFDMRISSIIVSTLIVSSTFSDRANRGLLVEAPATEEAAASLATGTKRRSALALAAMSRRTALKGRNKDVLVWLVDETDAGRFPSAGPWNRAYMTGCDTQP
jgi:hypothetical protein